MSFILTFSLLITFAQGLSIRRFARGRANIRLLPIEGISLLSFTFLLRTLYQLELGCICKIYCGYHKGEAALFFLRQSLSHFHPTCIHILHDPGRTARVNTVQIRQASKPRSVIRFCIGRAWEVHLNQVCNIARTIQPEKEFQFENKLEVLCRKVRSSIDEHHPRPA